MSPGTSRQSASETAPTERTVFTRPSPPGGRALIEIGTSPTPNAHSIANCPGSHGSIGSSTGVSVRVTVAFISGLTSVTR